MKNYNRYREYIKNVYNINIVTFNNNDDMKLLKFEIKIFN